MMCIYITFSKSDHSTPLHALHLPTQNILLAVNPFHCFFAKSWWAGKKSLAGPIYIQNPVNDRFWPNLGSRQLGFWTARNLKFCL